MLPTARVAKYSQLGVFSEIWYLRSVCYHRQFFAGIADRAWLLNTALDGITSEVHRRTLGLPSALEIRG